MQGRLNILIYGPAGTGKTPIGHTTPAPRLVLDAEAGSEFIYAPGGMVEWDPRTEPIPEGGGTDWETCVVRTQDWRTFEAAIDALNGVHPFVSVTLDSLTEIQKRCRDNLEANSRNGAMTEAAWGVLLREMESKLRLLRDLVPRKGNTLQVVVTLALLDDTELRQTRGGKNRPLLQGSLKRGVVSLPDVVGFLYPAADEEGNPIVALQITPSEDVDAKDRTRSLPNGGITGVFGDPLIAPINIQTIIETIYSQEA